MGTFSKGVLGGFSGTIGTVAGSSWKGISYMKSLPGKRKKPGTPAQLAQRAKFTLITPFLRAFGDLWPVTFNEFANGMSAFNSAFRYTISNAVKGTYPGLSIDYSLVLVSRGDLPNTIAPKAVFTAPGQLTFSWTDNSGTGRATATDKAVLVVYSPDRNYSIYTTAGANRSAGTSVLDVTLFAGLKVQTYIGFITKDGKSAATSIFTGELDLLVTV